MFTNEIMYEVTLPVSGKFLFAAILISCYLQGVEGNYRMSFEIS